MECLSEISRKVLQDNRKVFLAEQEKQIIQRVTSRIITAVIQESKISDIRQYIFSAIELPQSVDQLIESLKRRLPDCDITYTQDKGITVDWS